MNLKPYKPVVPEHHTIKHPFLERNFLIIGWPALLIGLGLVVYFTLK